MTEKRKVEIFSAGCAVCQGTISLIEKLACDSCDIIVLDMNEKNAAERARMFGVTSLPAVAIDGRLANCCKGRGPDEATMREAGLGVPLE